MNKTTPLIVAAFGCVLALALLTLDVPGLIIVAVLGIPAAWSVYQCMQTLMEHEAQLDARLLAFQARLRAQFHRQRVELPGRAYTGETTKLHEPEV